MSRAGRHGLVPVGLFDFSGAFESFQRYCFFFDYPRVDIFSFTKIGKHVSKGWILGFTVCQGFRLCAADGCSGLRAIFQLMCASWSLPNQNGCNNETS